MQIISVSRGTLAGGQELAELLAAKLGYPCLARELLAEQAVAAGIPLPRVEAAVLRRRPFDEQLNRDKERYKAFVAATLADRALAAGGLVYHGQTGQLVLSGVNHVLRLRAIMDTEARIDLAMHRLELSRARARDYVRRVDEDRQRWVRLLYNVDWRDPAEYDLVVNLSHVSVANAATGLVGLTQLPEFKSTPASERALADVGLAGRCRLAIGEHARTRRMDVRVKSKAGVVHVNYLPRHRALAPSIPEVLQPVAGIERVICTMASTNLLWIQESYDATGEVIEELLDIASRFESGIELVQLSAAPVDTPRPPTDENVTATLERLVASGHSGGHRRVRGGANDLLKSLDRTAPYSFIVVGNVFLSKPESVRKRLGSELIAFLSDNMRVPVLSTEELKSRTRFGPRQWVRMLGSALVAGLLFTVVFSHQREVLTFLSQEGTAHRVLATVCLLAFVPLFAVLYGGFTRQLLRLLKFE